jgi:hypothetical protein
VEADGWIHPASLRLLQLWQRELRTLGVADPGLTASRPLELSTVDTVRLLADLGLVIDHRRLGGPVYLDGTGWGLPLRQIVGPDGHVNYLVPILRGLIPLIGRCDRFLLVYDEELSLDHVLLDRVLGRLGASVTRLPLGRVPIDGVVRSSRYGGWEEFTLTNLSAGCLRHVDEATYRLGMRLYFIATLGPGQQDSFRHDLLRRSLVRAERLLLRSEEPGAEDAAGPCEAALAALLERHRRDHTYVDSYRFTSSLLGRRHRPARSVLARVFL